MILKHTPPPRRAEALRPLLRRKWLRRGGALLGLVGLLTGATLWGLYQGMYLYRVRVAASLADLLDDVVATRLAIVPNWIGGWWSADPERIVLDIKHEDFQKLAYQRELALERGQRIGGEDDFVPARIRHGGREFHAKVRLKGDWVDHLTSDKWSLRVKMRGEETLFGMKNFSIQHPQTRRYAYEWAFHQALAREDVVPLRYEFIDVTVNGKDLGVYALEEHFDKRLVEYRRRREGPILKFDESLHWIDIHATGHIGGYSATGLRGFRAAAVDAFAADSLREDPDRAEILLRATSLLESFRAGELPVAQVFDSRKLATYFALLDLLGAEHAAAWINLRFYYDPIASRLEPVGFDGNTGAPLQNVLGSRERLEDEEAGFLSILFADPAFVAEYVAALERVSAPPYLEALLADLAPGLERNLSILHREYPWLGFDPAIFRENQRTIRSVLAPSKGLHAYLDRAAASGVELELANLGPFPLEVLAARSGDVALAPAGATVLEATSPSERVDWVGIPFALRDGATWSDALAAGLEIEYRVLGSAEVRREKVFAHPRRGSLPAEDLLRQEATVHDFAFVEVDDAARVVSIRPGAWTIDHDLVVPAGYRFRCGAGTRIDLVRSAMILSRSPVEFRGTAAEPVVIGSSDGSGQGLLVIDAGERSTLEHVSFQGLRNPDRDGWQLTGAVTFYRSPVAISDSEFIGNHSEDGLNLVRSPFEIEAARFEDVASDAFDADFSDGSIRRSLFRGTGNDAIDVSGSRVTVTATRIERAGDKGMSAGEGSELTIRDAEIVDSSIGVASKDRSRVVAEGLVVTGVKVGFALYEKKSEFGPASMELRDLRLEGAQTPYLVERGSTLVLAGRPVESNANGVYAQLYGAGSG